MSTKVNPPAATKIEELESLTGELQHVRRQQKVLESECSIFKSESRCLLDKQLKEERFLERKHEELKPVVKALRSKSTANRNKLEDMEIQSLLQKYEKYKPMIQSQNIQLREMDFLIDKHSEELLEWKNSSKNQKDLLKLQRGNKKLEDRLYWETVRFNKMVAQNKSLRSETVALLKEREWFTKTQEQLYRNIAEAKSDMDDMLVQVAERFNQSRAASSKLATIQKSQELHFSFQGDMLQSLVRDLGSKEALHSFLMSLNYKREASDAHLKLLRKLQTQKDDTARKIMKNSIILDKIRTVEHENDFDQVLEASIKCEEENYTKFHLANVLVVEAQALKDNVTEVRQDMDSNRLTVSYRQERRNQELKNLQAELVAAKLDVQVAEQKANEAEEEVAALLERVEDLLVALYCDNSAVLPLLGDNSAVNGNNYAQYLEILEKQLDLMVNRVLFLQQSDTDLSASAEATEGNQPEKVICVDAIDEKEMKYQLIKANENVILPRSRPETLGTVLEQMEKLSQEADTIFQL